MALEKMETPEEKYNYLLMTIADMLKERDETILIQRKQISELEEKLAGATKRLQS